MTVQCDNRTKLTSNLFSTFIHLYILCTFASSLFYRIANSLRLSLYALKIPEFLIQDSFCSQLPCLKPPKYFISMSCTASIKKLWKMLSSLNVTYFPSYQAYYYFVPTNDAKCLLRILSFTYSRSSYHNTVPSFFSWICQSRVFM